MKLPYHFGRYTLLAKIAAGGMAEVYRARYEGEGGFSKIVAVKRILPARSHDDYFTAMFLDEAKVLTHLQHQNVVQVFELGRCEGEYFLAMEFVDGIDLKTLFLRLTTGELLLPQRFTLYIIEQLLQGLDFVHRAVAPEGEPLGLIHRDISLANVLVSFQGEVKITDFGIAKGTHRAQETTTVGVKGKYAYMSPEQATGQPIDQRTDLFAVGIIMFELLTGRRLFAAPTDLELIERVKRVTLPLEVLATLPPELQTILYSALAPEREARYQTAAQFLTDLHRYLQVSQTMASGFELGMWLREHFPHAAPPEKMSVGAITAVYLRRNVAVGKSAAMAAAALLLTGPILSHGMMPPETAAPPPPVVTSTMPSEPSPPPLLHGSIVIDSVPSHATGTVTYGGETRAITTPVTIADIPFIETLEGRVHLGGGRWQDVEETFHLSPEQPTFVKIVPLTARVASTLNVQAEPWGYVTIPGVVAHRETPVASLNVPPGTYVVRVDHPPTARVVTAEVILGEGERQVCMAHFSERATIACRSNR